MAKPRRDDILEAIATMAVISLAVWTISVPLQWGVVAGKVLGAQAVAAMWVTVGVVAILRSTEP